ncbi:hypothetical protein TOPH_04610 [Tolypocladium ophioglossoides CBS 100239]|uniref:Uncharacterized protein n=1 Tax=Tolypocladium ophioglossoides (strain CBS 100239) TaxID=1163406 RepID=A0A0L0N9M9_TOLOC|nr:hypothetical protein TOPH_04610 [Tolypocladium ophioglossoides CBS 100239]
MFLATCFRRNEAIFRKGVVNLINLFDVQARGPWISMAFPDVGLPLDVIPSHVKACAPIVLDIAPAEERDRDCSVVEEDSTMLVNLARGVQKIGAYSDAFLGPVEKYLRNGRLRIEKWLNVDPVSLLNTGDAALSVHHGGANCYREAVLLVQRAIRRHAPHLPTAVTVPECRGSSCLRGGLAQLWRIAEYLGGGLWPGKETAPCGTPMPSEGFIDGRRKYFFAGEGQGTRREGGRDAAASEVGSLGEAARLSWSGGRPDVKAGDAASGVWRPGATGCDSQPFAAELCARSQRPRTELPFAEAGRASATREYGLAASGLRRSVPLHAVPRAGLHFPR